MPLTRTVLISIFLIGLAVPMAAASQEGLDPILKFRIETVPYIDRGPIVASGHRNVWGGIEELTIEFQGKKTPLPAEVLSKIPRAFNGIQISSEPGYKGLGGYTVFLVFTEGWANSPEPRSRFVIAIPEEGGVRIVTTD